jgi:hypothetical protein
VRPANRSSACGSSGRIAVSAPFAPAGLPGRFTIRVPPNVPQTARLNAANGVCRSPSARIRSANPSIRRSQTSLVASGVTSRAASPVPPVVTIRSAPCACRRNATVIKSNSSGSVSAVTKPAPAASSNWRTAGPDKSTCSPREQRSLIVSTTARISDENLWATLPVYGFRPWVSETSIQSFLRRVERQK